MAFAWISRRGAQLCAPTTIIRIFILVLLGLTIYSNTFHAEFQFDDKDFIVNNPAIRDWTDMPALWNVKGEHGRFLTFVSFALNYRLHGLDVFGYHLVNVLIHIFNALLVGLLAHFMVTCHGTGVGAGFPGPPRKGGETPPLRTNSTIVPFFAALIFLTHPIQTETVSYISQRFASLAVMFYLLSLCSYIIARRGGSRTAPTYVLCAICAVAAMLSKQIAFTLPVVIVLFEIYFGSDWRRGGPLCPPNKGQPRGVAPTAIFIAFLLFIPFLYKFNLAAILGREYISRSHEGDYLYWLTYLLTQGRVLVVYLRLLLFPVGLNFEYDFPASTTLFDPATAGSFLLLLALFKLGLWLYHRNRIVSFCIMWFFVTLIVESSIIVLPHVIYEHRLYLPMVGFAILMAVVIDRVGAGFPGPPRKGGGTPPLQIIIAIAIISIYAALTFQRNHVWKNGIALWSDVIKKSPQKARPYHNRGFHYLEKGAFDLALADFNDAIRINPKYVQAYSNRATAHRALGQPQLALADYNAALKLTPNNAQALVNRGTLYAGAGMSDAAFADYAQALSIQPDYLLGYHNRGRLYSQMEQYDKAIADFSEAIRLSRGRSRTAPTGFSFSYAERGKAYLYKGRMEEAIADFTRAIALNPKDLNSFNNRAIAYVRQKEYDRAKADFAQVLTLDPGNANAYLNRSLLYLALKDPAQALADAQKAKDMGAKDVEKYIRELERLQTP